jgi:hypothetical protein
MNASDISIRGQETTKRPYNVAATVNATMLVNVQMTAGELEAEERKEAKNE